MITHPSLRRDIPETTKQRLFRYFHILVYDYNISHYLFTFLLLIEALQISYFAVHPVCCNLWQSSAFQITQQVLGSISGSYLWKLSNNSLLIALNVVFLVLLIIITLIIVYQVKNAKPEMSRRSTNIKQIRVRIVQYTSILFRTILVIPIISLSIYTLSAAIKDYNNSTSIVMIILSTISFFIFVSLTFLFLSLFIDNSPFSNFSLAGPITLREKIKTFIKVLIGFLQGFFDVNCQPTKDSIHLVLMVMLVLVLGYILYLNYTEPNLVQNMVRKTLEHTFASLTTFYIMMAIQKTSLLKNGITIIFLGMVIIGVNFGWAKIKQMRQKALIYNVYKSLTTKNQILTYNYLICQYIRDFHMKPLNLVILQGILNDHVLHCKKTEELCKCFEIKDKLKQFAYEKDAIQSHKQAPFWFKFMKINLQQNAQKMNHLPQFHLLLSYIQKTILGNNFLSYANLEKCSLKSINLATQFLIYHQKRVLQKMFNEEDKKNNEKKQVDVNRFIQMTNIVQKFQQIILKSSLEHLKFWKSLISRKKDKSVIMEEGNNLLITVKQCELIYKKITEQYPYNLECIVLFSNYSKYILNNHELIMKNKSLFKLIKKKLNRSVKMSGQQEKQKYHDNSSTGTIIISGQRNNVGIIKFCSSKVTKILKYSSYELVGQNINIIMPKFIGNMHNEVLTKYLEQGKQQNDFVQRLAPMMDKNNFLLLARIMTKPVPSLINGLQIIGIFERVKQKNIRHMNQLPKHLLYRCDTGNIEALSQNFYNYYGYRIMRVDQFSEISEELNFKTLFCDINSGSMKNSEEGVQCELMLKKQTKKKITIKAYIRMELVYFGATIRLLSIYSCGQGHFNSITIQNTMALNPATQVALSEKSETSEANGQQTAKSIQNCQGKQKQNKNEQVLCEQELKQLHNKVPFKFRVFQISLLIFILIVLTISSFQFRYNMQQSEIVVSFLDHTQWVSNSIVYLINIGYFSRMMQLSAAYPSALPTFNQYRLNVTVATDNLQKAEFWLVNKQNSYSSFLGFQFTEKPLIWQLGQQNNVSSKNQTLSLDIFDLVTSSSIFNSGKTSDFNFKFVLTNDSAAALTNSYFRNLFKIRYSSLYELIPAKRKYANKIIDSYNQKTKNYYKISKIQIGVSCGVIAIFLALMLKLIYALVKSIFSITSLFNWLTHTQIDKEVHRCQNFLQHFFIHHYEVIIQLNKSKILRGFSFQESFNYDQLQNKHDNLMKTGNYMDDQERNDPNLKENQCQSNEVQQIDLVNISEKMLKQKSIVSRIEGRNQEMVPLNVETIQHIEEEAEDDQSICIQNFTIFLPVILGSAILLFYFLGIFLFSGNCLNRTDIQFKNQNLLQKTLQGLDSLKYYGLQLIADPSSFRSYQNISISFFTISEEIYSLQQDLNRFSDSDNREYPLQELVYNQNMNGVCRDTFFDSVLYSQQCFNIIQCLSIDGGVLEEGLRASIVAYVQNLKNTTKSASLQEFTSSKQLKKVLSLDKYIKSSLQKIVKRNKQSSRDYFEVQKKITIALFSLFLVIIILVGVCINLAIDRDLKLKILGTYQIVSLIPQRIFKKNSNLCEEYRKNVKQLLE